MNLNEISTWYSPIGSYMTLNFDDITGIITGTYHTAPGGMTAALIGKYNLAGALPFGWTVAWPKEKYPTGSQTSWVATAKVINDVVTIEASWMIREKIYENPYFSTVCGCETYTPNAPSEETIEANKHKTPPHPL